MNLLSGLPAQGGDTALKAMRARGAAWIERAERLECPVPVPPATRPSPRPPVAARPRQLSVTQIQRLIRDPYAIYARHVLRLRPLDPLMQEPDALLRGTVLHKVLENFIRKTLADPALITRDALLAEARRVLAESVPWAEARAMWLARLERRAEQFIAGDIARRAIAQPVLLEARGAAELADLGFTLSAKADRIDRDAAGALHLYDYKTGAPPSQKAQRHFDKQLLLEAAMAELAGFGGLPPSPVASATFLGLGSGKAEESAPLDTDPPEKVWAELRDLIAAYMTPGRGYTARRAVGSVREKGDYDQLARFGEWDASDAPDPVEVG